MNITHLIISLVKVKSDKHRSEVPPPRAQSWRGNPHDEWLPHFPGRPRKAPGSFHPHLYSKRKSAGSFSSPSLLKPISILTVFSVNYPERFVNGMKKNCLIISGTGTDTRRTRSHSISSCRGQYTLVKKLQRSIFICTVAGQYTLMEISEVNIFCTIAEVNILRWKQQVQRLKYFERSA